MPDEPPSATHQSTRSRSKNGCLTCRRRKVRCNEQRPRCNHCERLNLQCIWRHPVRSNGASTVQSPLPLSSAGPHDNPVLPLNGTEFDNWDFNSIIWQDTSTVHPAGLDWFGNDGDSLDTTSAQDGNSASAANANPGTATLSASLKRLSWNAPFSLAEGLSPTSSVNPAESTLVEQFLTSSVPPILTSVEIGPRWSSAKMLLVSLATASNMVRNAIMAFSALQSDTEQDVTRTEHRALYDKAVQQLSSYLVSQSTAAETARMDLQYALTTVFFLAYSALLTNRVNDAHSLLQDGARLVRANHKDLTPVEKRLVSWIRLVDSRATAVGGQGMFLSETDREAFSPSEGLGPLIADPGSAGTLSGVDSEVEEILFDALYMPGLVFYQRVQSIMARVSAIDPWHRSRGTVNDETEVMSIAAMISKDLTSLEAQRPALMDHAVAGSLNDRHLAASLAIAITRSYRTYWANFQAGFLHLHRVAYKHLPPTAEVLRARSTIKKIAKLFEQSDDPLPVNFIWPLLMACCEEDNLDDRAWMIAAIRGMQSVASNAKPIAEVLEEVHKRQDATKQRADVRQVSTDMFNMAFAVV